jgi:hypothetical protein
VDTHMGTLLQTKQLFHVYGKVAQAYQLPRLLAREVGGEMPAWATPESKSALVDRVLQMMPGVPADKWFDAYKQMLAPLPPGVYQLIVQLAHDEDEMQGATAGHPDWGAAWRQHDFDLVKSDEFRAFLKQQGFQLITWRELAKARPVADRR